MAKDMLRSRQILPGSFDFLTQLKNNNNREWFTDHKTRFLKEQELMAEFTGQLLLELNTHDMIETQTGKASLHRIYRDVRFRKDKTPYRPGWSGGFKRASIFRRGGYYYNIEPGNTFVGGGFRGPNADDLKLIREDISFDAAPLRKILNAKSFKDTFGTLRGEQLKTTPKGFAADNEGIDLLRYKQFLLVRRFTDEEVLQPDFFDKVSKTYKNMRPFFNYMSEVLTSDSNGY
jgi:uncharacterized protein (TIGR02453 family)